MPAIARFKKSTAGIAADATGGCGIGTATIATRIQNGIAIVAPVTAITRAITTVPASTLVHGIIGSDIDAGDAIESRGGTIVNAAIGAEDIVDGGDAGAKTSVFH